MTKSTTTESEQLREICERAERAARESGESLARLDLQVRDGMARTAADASRALFRSRPSMDLHSR
jgi:hypothetical protein